MKYLHHFMAILAMTLLLIACAEFGLLLRASSFKQNSSYDQTIRMGRGAAGTDEKGDRSEFIKLVEIAALLPRLETVSNK